MIKKTFIIFTVMVAISIFGMGAFNTASADDFNIQLLSVERDHGDVFKYNYLVSSGSLNISKISILNFGVDANLVIQPGDYAIYLPPTGWQVDGWLAGVPQLQVISITPQSTTEQIPLTIYVSGSNGSIGDVAAHTKAGNKIDTQVVDGPVTGLPVDASVPSTKVVVLNDMEFCIDIDPRTGCPYPDSVPYNCETLEELDLDEDFVIGTSSNPEAPTIIQGEGSDPRCPISKAAHNPCQWVVIGGRAYGPYCW